MEAIHINTSTELKRAKDIMMWAIFAYIGCYVIALMPILEIIGNLLLIAAWIVGCYGLYCFSKVANSPSFKYYILSIVVIAVFYVIFMAVVLWLYMTFEEAIGSNTLESVIEGVPWLSLGVFMVVVSLGVMAIQVFLTYKVSYEMSNITGLKHFITAYKIYLISVVGIMLLSIVFGYLVIDFIQQYGNDAGLLESLNYIEEYALGRIASLVMLGILLLVMGICVIAYNILIVLGVYNIQEVKVCEKLQN